MINTKPLETGERYRSPDKFDKYADPYDNLAYAMLCSAMTDLKNPRYHDSAIEWLEGDGRDIYEYLKDRPLNELSEHAIKKRRQYAKKRSHINGIFIKIMR